MSTADAEEVLLTRLRAKDERAFEYLFDSFSRRAFGLAYELTRDRGAAEEVVQEAFLALWQHSERLDPKKGRLAPLLLAIVHHKASDYLRRQRVRQNVTGYGSTENLTATTVDPADAVIQRLNSSAVRDAIASLSLEQRLTVQLAYFGGHSHSEIARVMQTPLGTVKTRLRLALKRLHRLLGSRVR